MNEFKAGTTARLAGFLVFLLVFCLAMLGGAVLLAMGLGLLAIAVMFVGVGLASFAGIAVTGRISRRRLELWRARQSNQPFVIEEP
jgi:hypothetical protein